jgi:hypothetical protein
MLHGWSRVVLSNRLVYFNMMAPQGIGLILSHDIFVANLGTCRGTFVFRGMLVKSIILEHGGTTWYWPGSVS